MSNILLTCSCDSLAAKVIEKMGANNPVFFEPETNTSDVFIAETICTHIFYIVLVGVLGFVVWKLLDHVAKGISEYYKRRCVVKDKELKQKADLLDKYLDFLKERTREKNDIPKDNNEEKQKGIKKVIQQCSPDKKTDAPQSAIIDLPMINQYRQVLEYIIELSQKGTLNTISKEDLDKIFEQPKDEN